MRLGDRVLQQAVGEDHVRAHQLAAAGDLVFDERAVVDAELEVQIGRAPARLARAARRQRDRAPAAGESEIGRVERREQRLAVERLLRRRHAEHRVSLELGQPQWGAQAARDHAEQVREDVVGVLELDAGEVGGVAADVGEHEAAFANALVHCSPRLALAELRFRGRRSG
jgi:hypothetical protein